MYPTVVLKASRPGSRLARHPWIYSGAIQRLEPMPDHGSLVTVRSPEGEIVGTGTWSDSSMIAVRLFSFDACILDASWLEERIRQADQRRMLQGLGPGTSTTGYRVVFGESDWLPGLVVDRYEDCLVFQIATAGMELLKDNVITCLERIFEPRVLLERSDMATRAEESLEPSTAYHRGGPSGPIPFLERGRRCLADIEQGQKTGYFLDQRDLRDVVQRLAPGKEGLDLFSYSGATAMAALLGGATTVTCVDSSEAALALCRQHAAVNQIEPERIATVKADVFQWVSERSEPAYGIVLLDPPALIKSRKHLEHGRKGYHFLNRAALRLVVDGGLLVTSSCSAYFGEDDFLVTLRRAADQSGVRLQLLAVVRQAVDHPLSLYFPESGYLKSFVCQVYRS